MTIFDEISPVLAYLLLIPLVIAIIRWEWVRSEKDRQRRKQQAAAFDAQRQRWLKGAAPPPPPLNTQIRKGG